MSLPNSTKLDPDGLHRIQLADLVSRKNVAEMATCHVRTVVRAERRGELTAIKFSPRLVRYTAEDVRAWIQRSKTTNKA